ncbi:MAG: alpha-L-fucosidase [Victivallales bacterium]|nr:alpha-L-fucosidase [Victivallales bacterium]
MTSVNKDLIMRAAQVTPSIRQLKWQEMELTAFIHFTVNTFTDKEWGDGSESPSIFNPVQCDPRQWIKNLKDAGFKMTILTAKHHDGFCLWPSKYTEHSIKNSPYKNGNGDIVREFCAACREFDMKIGLYLSPWDRHEESYGDSPRYNEYFKNQLRELCAYGEIACFWFDGACAEGPNGKRQEYDWDGYYALIRELQPDAIIDDVGPDARWCGNEAGKGREAEWSVVNMNKSFVQFNSENCTLDTIGSLEQLGEGENLYWYPSEVDTSIRPGWFYHASEDKKVKSLKKLVQIYINSVGGNAVLLLNFPPDKRGLLHENDVARLKEFREYLDKAFEVNYAGNAKIKASAEKPGFEAEKILDDNPESYWTVADWTETAELELNLDTATIINTVMLQEQIRAGQRIENFAIDCHVDSLWREVAAGKTVGYKKIICFNPVRADAVRIRITGSRLCPTLSNCAIYNMPEIAEDTSANQSLDRSDWKIISVTSELHEYEAVNVIKDNASAPWTTAKGLPQEIIIDMGGYIDITGFTYMPVQNSREGHVLDYEFYLSNEPEAFNAPLLTGEFSNTVNNPIMQSVLFSGKHAKGRYIKFRILSTHGGCDFASVQSLGVIPE